MKLSASLLLLFVVASVCQATDLVSQLEDPRFPDRSPSSRRLTNNKRTFKAYAKRDLVMTVKNSGAGSAQVEINGRACDISGPLREGKLIFEVNLAPYIWDGNDNTLSVQEISPKGAYLELYIPYPGLIDGKPEDVGFDPLKLKLVEERIKADVKKGFPGAAIIVAKNGRIVERFAHGYARMFKDDGTLMEKFVEMTISTIFDMASNTKMFTTLFSLMKLFHEKKFRYVDPVHKYIPEYAGTDKHGERREDRLIMDLMTHTAGYLPDPHFFNPAEIPPEEYTMDKARTAEILYHVHGFNASRGGLPNYSDVDYMLLSLLVERLAGMPLDQYVESTLYKPLGLKNTLINPLRKGYKKEQFAATEVIGNTYNWTVDYPHIRKTVLQGEVDDPKVFYCMDGNGGAAGLFSTIDDMAVLCQVMLNRGGYGNARFWDRSTQDLFVKPYDRDLTFGLGWRRAGNAGLKWHFSAYASDVAIGHTGWTGTVTVIDPKYDLTIVLLTNKKHSRYYKGEFEGDAFSTGQYGDIVQLVYEAMII